MKSHFVRRVCLALMLGLIAWSTVAATCTAGEILIADRLANRVVRYSSTGSFIDYLVDDDGLLNEPNGISLSPDQTKLYVSNRQAGTVVRYDYNYLSGTATNGTNLITGVNVPASVIPNGAGTSLYVATTGPTFQSDVVKTYNSAGVFQSDLTGGLPTARTALAFVGSDLLVGSFFDNKILKYSNATGSPTDFITGSGALPANMLVNGNDLYVVYAGSLDPVPSGSVRRYNATTGAIDNTFAIDNLPFPASIALNPNGNGILLGVLELTNGSGRIDAYSFSGTFDSVWASNVSANPPFGFSEATGMVAVPEPSTVALGLFGAAGLGFFALRRQRSKGRSASL